MGSYALEDASIIKCASNSKKIPIFYKYLAKFEQVKK
jgi:hypothetical protein